MPGVTAVRPVGYGRLDAIELQGDRLRVVVCPAFGGRVTSFVDRTAGRDWLLPGIPPDMPSAGHGATFGPDEATGWDECLPTVSPAADPLAAGRALRDHGDVWGRHLASELTGGRVSVALEHAWADDGDRRYVFRRTFAVDGPTLRVEYTLESRAAESLPFLWSMHPLLALEPGARLLLPRVTDALATSAVGPALEGLLQPGEASRVSWPDVTSARGAYRLDTIPGLDAREAVKLYAGPVADGRAAVVGIDASWLGFEWDSSFAPYVGVWLSHGAWPDPASGVRQAALEPTTAPADDLGGAIAAGRAVTLPPGGRLGWWASLTAGTGPDTLAGFLAGRHEPA